MKLHERDLEEKPWRYVVGLPWKSRLKSALKPHYILEREGGALPWGPRTLKGSTEPRGEGFPSQTESYLVWKFLRSDRGGESLSFEFVVSKFSANYQDQLEVATDGFSASRELGDGGFGTVYKGKNIKLKDGRVVAVKRLYKNNYRRVEQFLNEVDILSRLLHQNLVILYGCTSRMSRDLLLVYEFIANGTIADHLHGTAYLHAVEIIHRDVKTTNILLDNSFHVKVADFGLSRLFAEVTHVSTVPRGTPARRPKVPPRLQAYRQERCVQLWRRVDSNHEVARLVDPELGHDRPQTKRTTDRRWPSKGSQMEREMRPSIKEVVEILTYVKDGDYQSKSMRKKASHKEDVHLLTDGVQFSPDTVIHRFHSQSTNHSVASNASGL
ncbi:hypothetical protein ZWY2020_042071 [Hordeum vulgare]|nr:hypothetical protein ZWY2020_042071 [Hordeum vulgare]